MATIHKLPPRSKPRAVPDAPFDPHAMGPPGAEASPEFQAPAPPAKPPLTLEQRLAILAKHPAGDIGAAYLKIRDQKRALEEQAEELGKQLAVLDLAILAHLEREKQTSFGAVGMTIYRYTKTTARVTDAGTLTDWVLESPKERLEVMEVHASKKGAESYWSFIR